MWRASLILAFAATAAADTRAELSQQLADEAMSVDSALGLVIEKLDAIDAERTKRLSAAYRTLTSAANDSMTLARRRAAARMLVGRDLAERSLLAGELVELQAARARLATEVARVPEIALPSELSRPANGTTARKFGTFVHERSKATLSRRGIDIEVDAKSPVIATADGTVRYAGQIRGLDKGIIIDHGSYFTVIAKLGELAVPIGVPVKRGDRVGRAARQRVYVEVRVKIGPSGLPIDPEPLFAR